MDSIVEVRELSKAYEDFALHHISLTVSRGSITGIFGPNGAGKSTLVKVIARQSPAQEGSVLVFGLSGQKHQRHIKNTVGYVPQEPAFFMDKTVQWTAQFVAPYFAGWEGSTFCALLDDFKVNPLKKVKHLSGGQKKLLSLALALSHQADLLILDEPTAGLDALHRRALLERLRAFVADGKRAVLVASHITDGLDEITDQVCFLRDGRALLCEDRDDLLARWKWIRFAQGALPPAIEGRLRDVRRQPYGDRGLTDAFPSLRSALTPALADGLIQIENPSIQDILISLVKEA